jgi:hypothetical protein
MSTNNITRSKVEEENSPPYPKDAMMDLKKKTTNSKDTMHYIKRCPCTPNDFTRF